jgi:preprotein translocase subunit SecG
MTQIVLIVHLLIAAALVGVVLVQRSEGGALGIGGGAGGGFMSARGSANLLTRTTAILAGGFMMTSLILAMLAGTQTKPRSIIDGMPAAPAAATGEAPAGESGTPMVPLSR